MDNIQEDIKQFSEDILDFHIPRWEELPDIELYMDQTITFIERAFSCFSTSATEKIITPSMINNYVKLNLIPKPIRKKYNKVHLAYLIAITILKHVFTIQEVKDGIQFQAKINGEKRAYNNFCEEQEKALKDIIAQITSNNDVIVPSTNLNPDNIVVKLGTLAFASKIIVKIIIGLKKNQNDDSKNDREESRDE